MTTTNSYHAHPVAENVLARDFTADKPNQQWFADTTCITTLKGLLYLEAVLDLFHSQGGGLVDVGVDRQPIGGRCIGDGGITAIS